MPKVTIEVPEGFEEVVKQLEQTLQRAQKGVEGAQAGDMAAFDTAWQGVNARVEESERQLKQRLLRVLDIESTRPKSASTASPPGESAGTKRRTRRGKGRSK